MSLAKKSWKRVIALFLAVVMAIAFAPNIAARAAISTAGTYIVTEEDLDTIAEASDKNAFKDAKYGTPTEETLYLVAVEDDGSVAINTAQEGTVAIKSVTGTTAGALTAGTAGAYKKGSDTYLTVTAGEALAQGKSALTVATSATTPADTYTIVFTYTPAGGSAVDKTVTLDVKKLKIEVPEFTNNGMVYNNANVIGSVTPNNYYTLTGKNTASTAALTGSSATGYTVTATGPAEYSYTAKLTNANVEWDDTEATADKTVTFSVYEGASFEVELLPNAGATDVADASVAKGTSDAAASTFVLDVDGDTRANNTSIRPALAITWTATNTMIDEADVAMISGVKNTAANLETIKKYFTFDNDETADEAGSKHVTIKAKENSGFSGSVRIDYTVEADPDSRNESSIDARSLIYKTKPAASGNVNYTYGSTDGLKPTVTVKKGTGMAATKDTSVDTTTGVDWWYVNSGAKLPTSIGVVANAAAGVDAFFENGALKSAMVGIASNNVPSAAGTYYVYAVIKGDTRIATKILFATLTIDPLTVYVVPENKKAKSFGDPEAAIDFDAYTEFNLTGETNAAYLTRIAKIIFNEDIEADQYDATSNPTGNFEGYKKRSSSNLQYATVLSDAEYKAYVDGGSSGTPVTAAKGTQAGELWIGGYKTNGVYTAEELSKLQKKYESLINDIDNNRVSANDPVAPVEYAKSKIDQTNAPLLVRKNWGSFATEVPGEDANYLIVSYDSLSASKHNNAIAFPNYNVKVLTNLTQLQDVDAVVYSGNTNTIPALAEKDNAYYKINKRDISKTGVDVALFVPGATGAVDKRATKADFKYNWNNGESIVPEYKVFETIQLPKKKTVNGTTTIADPVNGRWEYEQGTYIIGAIVNGAYDGSASNVGVGGDKVTGIVNFAPSGTQSASASNTYKINLTAGSGTKACYTGTKSFNWTIGASGLSFKVATIKENEDTLDNDPGDNANVLSDNTMTVNYDQEGHGINVYIYNTVAELNGNDQAIATALVPNKDYKVFYRVAETFEYVDGKTISTADKTDKWTQITGSDLTTIGNYTVVNLPDAIVEKMVNAGTYHLEFKIEDQLDVYDDYVGDLFVKINPIDENFEITTKKVTAKVFDEKAEVDVLAKAANETPAIIGKEWEYNPTKKIDELVENGDVLVVGYEYDATACEGVNTVPISLYLKTADEVKQQVIDAHKAAYEAGTVVPAITLANGKVVNNYRNYSTATVKDGEGNDVAAITSADGTNFPAIGERKWSALTEAQVKALTEADIKEAESYRRVNDNYKPHVVAGDLVYGISSVKIDVIVHDSEAWDTTNNKWLDFNVNDGYSAAWYDNNTAHAGSAPERAKKTTGLPGTADADAWDYGMYDLVGNKIEVVLDKGNGKGYRVLPDVLKENLKFTASNALGTPEFYNIDPSKLEDALFALKGGTYTLQARVEGVPNVVDVSFGTSAQFTVGESQYKIDTDDKGIVDGGEVVRTVAPTKFDNVIVRTKVKEALTPEGKQTFGASTDTYVLKFSLTGSGDSTDPGWETDMTKLGTIKEDNANIKWYNSTKAEQTLYVKAVPVAALTASNSVVESEAVKIKFTIVPVGAGENDKVADVNMLHTKDDAGKVVTVGYKTNNGVDASITKVYGKYTENEQYENGEYKLDENTKMYKPVQKDNEVYFGTATTDLLRYVRTELLASNGYAVGKQNTYLNWGKDVDGNTVLKRYEDASKVAQFPWFAVSEGTYAGINYAEDFERLDAAYEIDKDGNIVFQAAKDELKDSATIEPAVYYNTSYTTDFDTVDNTHRDMGVAAKLLDGAKISAVEVVDNKDGIIATKTSGSGASAVTAPDVSLSNNVLRYTLAKDAKSGKATLKLTVERNNFGKIYFNVNVTLDAEKPEVSIANAKIATDPSTTVNTRATVTDVYVNEPLVFDVTVTGAEKDASYYFADSAKTTGELAVLYTNEKFTKIEGNTIATPEKDGGYILYVRAEDESGNVTWASSAKGYTVDTTKPEIRNAADAKLISEDEVATILVEGDASGAISISDAKLKTEKPVLYSVGDTVGAELTMDSTKNYKLAANADTYTVTAEDAAGNVTTVKINVNKKVNNTKNDITLTYTGEDIDLATLADPADATKKLFTVSADAGAASYSDATEEVDEKGNHVYTIAGERGKGTVEGTKLKVTQAGTFAIKLTTAKNGIYGETDTVAFLTVNRGIHQVGIKLVEDPSAAELKAKTEFTDSEVVDIAKYVKLVFTDSDDYMPAADYITYSFYKKGSTTKETDTPKDSGDYEVAVEIKNDGLYEATASLTSTDDKVKEFQKAEFKLGATNKIKITNDDTKGTVTVTDATGKAIEDLNAVAKSTKVVITVAPAEGYTFDGWTDVKGVTLQDAKAVKIEAEVSADIELTTNYVEGIKITTQPKDAEAYAGETETFTVVATGNGEDDLTYQWETKAKNEVNFRPITGATEASYTTGKVTTADDGSQFRVAITSKKSGEVRYSDVATLKVAGHSIEGAVVTLKESSAEYTGKNIVPVIDKVVLGSGETAIELVSTRDYDVVVVERVNAGEYEVKITGKGDYSGEASAKFTITPKALTKDMFLAEDVQYTGKEVETTIVGKDGETELKADTDYTVAYKDNTEVGTATATITGKGNYTGSVDVTFEVLGKSIKGATVSGLKTVAYTGKAIAPAVTVKLDGKTLKKGTDYTVTYKNNTKVGTATVTITGKGDYSGTITKKFLIKKISFKYRAYVQKKNWMAWSTAKVSGTSASAMAGTTDNLRMETIQMQLTGVSGAIKYRAYVEKMGWTQWATTADTTTYAGTKGMARRVEMIQLQASGQVATLYDMYYRAYSEKFGWLGWAKSGEKAGSAGYARKLEAFQVNFVRKGESFTVKSDRTKCFYDKTKDGANPK